MRSRKYGRAVSGGGHIVEANELAGRLTWGSSTLFGRVGRAYFGSIAEFWLLQARRSASKWLERCSSGANGADAPSRGEIPKLGLPGWRMIELLGVARFGQRQQKIVQKEVAQVV